MIFGGYIRYLWGVYQIPLENVNNFCMRYLWGVYQIPLGGISDTFGGYIRYLWGVYQIPKYPLTQQKRLSF
jgi:hypothetical protein